MKLTWPRVSRQRSLATLLAIALFYPCASAKNVMAATTINSQKTVAAVSLLKSKPKHSHRAKLLKPSPKSQLKDKRMAMMYYLWFALKHNR